MELRKRLILEATITDYIKTAEPVGSSRLLKQGNFQVSSATIRNELNELEKQGYLKQVYTSSGRVPTDKGYRLYVDTLMNIQALPATQRQHFIEHIFSIGTNTGEVLEQITNIVSSIIDYTTIVVTPNIYQEVLKVVHLVLVDLDKILVVLLNSVGANQEFLMTVQDEISQEDLNKISNLLTSKLEGKNLSSIDEQTFAALVSELPQFKSVLGHLFKEVKHLRSGLKQQAKIAVKGVSKMIKLPEFQNVEVTQKVLGTLEESKSLCSLLLKVADSKSKQIFIGTESEIEDIELCSMVVAPYLSLDTPVGLFGVLGPKRMAYSKIIPLVEQISKAISEYLKNKV